MSGAAKIIAKSTKYHMVSNPCGALIFKLILQKYIIDIRDIAFNMRYNLSSIDTSISTENLDIDKFIEYAKINYEAHTTRGERYDNIMSNLFKGYVLERDK